MTSATSAPDCGAWEPSLERGGTLQSRVLCALTLVLTVLVYASSLSGDWVWDDVPQFRDNPAITHPLTLVTNDVWSPTGKTQPSNLPIYRPLAMVTHVPGQLLWPGPFVERLLNLVLFLALVMGVGHLGGLLGLTDRARWFGALCLATHPAATESVAWISCRGELMGAGFVLAGLIAWERRRDAWSGLLFALAPFCKETFLLTPAVVLLWMCAERRRSFTALGGALAGGVLYLGIRVALGIPLPGSSGSSSATEMLGGIGAVAMRALELLTIPTAPDVLEPLSLSLWMGALTLVVAGTACFWLPGRPVLAVLMTPLPLTALAAPASLANGIVSDRYFLAATVAFAVAAGMLYAAGERRTRWVPALLALPLVWMPFSASRANDWRSNLDLFSASLDRRPNSAKALFHLGYHYHTSVGDCARAIEYYGPAMREDTRAANNLQACLLDLKRFAEAAAMGPGLAARDPRNPTPALNTARALVQLGHLPEAERWTHEGLRRAGPTPKTLVLLGNLVGMQGRHQEALRAFESALQLEADYAPALAGRTISRRKLDSEPAPSPDPSDSPTKPAP